MRDVLMLTYTDSSNSGWRFSQALQSAGINAELFKGKGHIFNYPVQGTVLPQLHQSQSVVFSKFPWISSVKGMEQYVEESKVINFSAGAFFNMGVDLTKKIVIVTHGGSAYRRHPAMLNSLFNRLVSKTIIQSPDLLGLGAINEVYVKPPVDTNFLQPDYTFAGTDFGQFIIGHFPSTPKTKGTAQIIKTIEWMERHPLKKRLAYTGVRVVDAHAVRVGWLAHLKRIRACDVVIETCMSTLHGAPYGETGIMAMEAAALGKIVITNAIGADIYEREYGVKYPYLIANNPVELRARLQELADMDNKEIIRLKIAHRRWVEEHQSLEAVGRRLKRLVYNDLL
jgi:hypothetical protein